MEASDRYQVHKIKHSSKRMAIGNCFTAWSLLSASEREAGFFRMDRDRGRTAQASKESLALRF